MDDTSVAPEVELLFLFLRLNQQQRRALAHLGGKYLERGQRPSAAVTAEIARMESAIASGVVPEVPQRGGAND